jgi:hypothetical protein
METRGRASTGPSATPRGRPREFDAERAVDDAMADFRARLRGALVAMVLGLTLAVQGGYAPDARTALVAAVRDDAARWSGGPGRLG